jgi:hypothetical protein
LVTHDPLRQTRHSIGRPQYVPPLSQTSPSVLRPQPWLSIRGEPWQELLAQRYSVIVRACVPDSSQTPPKLHALQPPTSSDLQTVPPVDREQPLVSELVSSRHDPPRQTRTVTSRLSLPLSAQTDP